MYYAIKIMKVLYDDKCDKSSALFGYFGVSCMLQYSLHIGNLLEEAVNLIFT